MRYTNVMKNTGKLKKGKTAALHVYSLVLTVNDTGVYLYTGVHTNLDDAVAAANEEALQTIKLPKGQTLDTELDIWTTYDGRKAITELLRNDPLVLAPYDEKPATPSPIFYSETDCRVRIENARNALMKMLVDKKDSKKLDENRALLTTHQYKYVKAQIEQTK